MAIVLTVAFNFLDLEDLDADYERSVEQAVRVASLFQASAGADSLGRSFLSTGADPFAAYIQRVRFEHGSGDAEAMARTAVANLARQCRSRLLTDGPSRGGVADASGAPGRFPDRVWRFGA